MTQDEQETILLVDDDRSSRRSLAMVFEHIGYRTIEASSGDQALQIARNERPNVALLDIRLPDRGGMDVLSELQEIVPDIAVVMVTAFASVETAVAALNRGAAAYILKPFNLDDVLVTIRQCLEKQRLVRENRRLVKEVKEELRVRRQAEAERDLLVKAVASAGESIVVADADGAVRHVNPAFESTTGFSPYDVLGHDHLRILDGRERGEEGASRIQAALDKRGVWSGTLKSRRKNGDIYYEECTITRVADTSGKTLNFVHVRRDVSQRMKLEAIAEAVNTTNNIGYVFSGLRHELGNPINSIQMTLKMLRARADSPDPEAIKNYLDRALGELDRVRFLLQSLKSFNMYEALELKEVALASYVEQFQALVRGDSIKRGVALETHVEPQTLSAQADPRALQQVLLNVFTNALDACVNTENPIIKLSAHRHRSEVQLELSDNGLGMSPDELENLFRPFVTNKTHGTGLGLVIAKKMMAQMKGAIEVQSTKHSGTSVLLTLPEWSFEQERQEKSDSHH